MTGEPMGVEEVERVAIICPCGFENVRSLPYDISKVDDCDDCDCPNFAMVGKVAALRPLHSLRSVDGCGWRCSTCGTHEVSLEQTCHNSACGQYALPATVYEGWRTDPANASAAITPAVEGELVERVKWILDPTASATERMTRRAALTNWDLRRILNALQAADRLSGEGGE